MVAVGESALPRVTLIDISDLNNPRAVGGPFATSIASGFGSLAFLDQNVVVGAGPNEVRFVKVDFGNPMMPRETLHQPGLPGSPTVVDADPTSHRIVAASPGGRQVKLFDGNLSEIGAADSTLPGVLSVSLSGQVTLVASQLTPQVALIDFRVSPPRVTPFDNLVGTSSVAFDGRFGACASQVGTPSVSFWDLGGTPHHLGTLPNVGIASVTSIGMQTFASVPPSPPDIAASPTTLVFNVVPIGTTKDLSVQIRNTGHDVLTIGGIQTSDPRFAVVNAPANLRVQPNNSAPLTVRFQPDTVGQINASLTMVTNVPRTPNFSVPLTGTGKIVVAFAPSPNQFDPKAGVWDSEVTLFGRNFDLGMVTIQFGPEDLPGKGVLSVTPTQIVAKVPAGTGSGPLVGPVRLIVSNDAGTATSDDMFTVIPT
jgi:hypothetical protein